MRLLKIDTLYPAGYLNQKKAECKADISKMSFPEYHQWLLDLKLCFSDFYTYNLTLNGWDAQVFYLDEDTYLKKAAKHYYGFFAGFVRYYHKFRNMISVVSVPYTERLLEKHIKSLKPDVLFLREGLYVRNMFWKKFQKEMLLVSRIECKMGEEWTPLIYDLIYTNIESYKDYFKTLKIPYISNTNGFDHRILDLVKFDKTKKYDVTYIGGLGTSLFERRTRMFEEILQLNRGRFTFYWWGDKLDNDFDLEYPLLSKCYMGYTGGLEMFQVYADSKIILNDYGDDAGNAAVNMRIFEAMGIGTLLLTRKSYSLQGWDEYLVSFEDPADCYNKIIHLLDHPDEREAIAFKGHKFVLENYNYKNLMKELGDQMTRAYQLKFNR